MKTFRHLHLPQREPFDEERWLRRMFTVVLIGGIVLVLFVAFVVAALMIALRHWA
jgi:hypothetical protein